MNSREMKNFQFRKQVRQLISEGNSVSAIAKLTGHSYLHTKQIAEQECGVNKNSTNSNER